MEISEKLEADLESMFTRRTLAEGKLKKKRPEDKKRRSSERMSRKREVQKDLEDFSRLSSRLFGDKESQLYKRKLEDDYEREKQSILSKEGTVTQSLLKGKDTPDLNTFLVSSYYWIKKEKPGEPDSEILKYICDFLKGKNYRMKDGKNYYDIDALKTRIRDHYKKKDPDDKRRMERLLDRD